MVIDWHILTELAFNDSRWIIYFDPFPRLNIVDLISEWQLCCLVFVSVCVATISQTSMQYSYFWNCEKVMLTLTHTSHHPRHVSHIWCDKDTSRPTFQVCTLLVSLPFSMGECVTPGSKNMFVSVAFYRWINFLCFNVLLTLKKIKWDN